MRLVAIQKKRQFYLCFFSLAIILWLLPLHTAFALMQQAKTWAEITATGPFTTIPKLEYILQEQSRYNFTPNQFQQELILGGIGYRYTPVLAFWAGYQWSSHNSLNGDNSVNTFWQQASWQIIKKSTLDFTSRTRFEERTLGTASSWNYRLREQFAWSLPRVNSLNYIPVIRDEVFINLTRPAWVTGRTLDQNRAFAGVDIPTSKRTYLEAGYLNQYLFKTSGNQMNHILYIGFTINTGV